MSIARIRLFAYGRRLMHLQDTSLAFSTAPNLSLVLQIKRAKQQLMTSPENHPAIQAALDNGRVKPFFHTLFLPETFLSNRRCFTDVRAGEVDPKRKLEFEWYGKNLGKVVGNTGKAAGTIIDDRSTWDFSHRLTAFAVELVNTDAEMLGEDIECTKLTSIPIGINPGRVSNELLTRRESRGVVSNVFHRFAREPGRGSVAAITGSEGVGKSWTLLYALQQALIYDGATVLFFQLKSGRAAMYLRRKNKMYAWSSVSSFACSTLFEHEDVLVLVDPPEPSEEQRLFTMGDMKLLHAANNKSHISAKDENGNLEAYLGPPLDSELSIMLKRLAPSVTQSDINERTKHIGNLVRYVMSAEQYYLRWMTVVQKMEECADNPTLLWRALGATGLSIVRNTIPGTLFEMLPARPRDLTTIGYEGQEIKYRRRVVRAVNQDVRDAILRAGRGEVLRYWGTVSGDECTTMKLVAKRLFIEDLTNPNGMVMFRYSLRGIRGEGWDKSALVVKSGMLVQSGVTTSEQVAAVLGEPSVVAEVAANISEQIDAAGPGRKLYHLTTSTDHSMSLAAMTSICKNAGLINEDGNIAPEDTVDKLELYWVVPNSLWKVEDDKYPYQYQGLEDQESWKLVSQCLAMHVHQFVLPMTLNNPVTFSEWESGREPHWT